ncbi:MAG: hypothetical protein PHS14_12875, partial [Elusimicrobia bacterium]|nr:hypothetical protein [Elusimicrobiota bacterium]
MGYPSRRESRPGATRRLTACALTLSLVLQGAAPACAAAAARIRPVSAAIPVTILPPAEALRDAVAASGWADSPAVLTPVPAATPRLAPPSGPQAAFDALVKMLAGAPGAGELRVAAADAAAVAPAAGRAAAREWAKTYGESAPAARKAMPELARALGLITGDSRAERGRALAAQDMAEKRVAALAMPDFGGVRTVRAIAQPAALHPERPRLPDAALAESELRQRLGQSGDLAGGAADADAIAGLDRLLERVSPLLPEGEGNSGAEDSRESKWASLEALRRMFDDA